MRHVRTAVRHMRQVEMWGLSPFVYRLFLDQTKGLAWMSENALVFCDIKFGQLQQRLTFLLLFDSRHPTSPPACLCFQSPA